MKRSLVLASLIVFVSSLFGQIHPTCNGTRYVTYEFQTADTTKNIQFGTNLTWGGSSQDLFMDIYEPTGDQATERPVLLLAFGGSFIGGSRQDIEDICVDYAKRGFVAVTIDYRLYDGPFFPFPSAATMIDVLIKAMGDMKAAVRYLKEDAATNNVFKVDTNLIFVGGIGSGAMVANHLAYLDSTDVLTTDVSTAISSNGGWPGNSSSNFQYSSEVAGVINFSGAILDTNYFSPGDVPIFSAHDDADGTIPYGTGDFVIIGVPIITVSGSGDMHISANTNSISNQLITIPNSTGHVSYMNDPTWKDSVLSTSAQFLNDIICFNPLDIKEVEESTVSKVYPNPNNGQFSVAVSSPNTVIKIFNTEGRLVFSEINPDTRHYNIQLDIPGIYFLEISDSNKRTHHKLVVK
ncbi:MAG: T9SS type A sorting domain-containing protein [Flavobacteriales bacterium]|nr:T9SS type A sorting domain-containing protein [Flavobacteriales bacterium]